MSSNTNTTSSNIEAQDSDYWQGAVFTLMGYASGLYAQGQIDMPEWLYGLAEKIARTHVDEAHAQRIREIATQERAKYEEADRRSVRNKSNI